MKKAKKAPRSGRRERRSAAGIRIFHQKEDGSRGVGRHLIRRCRATSCTPCRICRSRAGFAFGPPTARLRKLRLACICRRQRRGRNSPQGEGWEGTDCHSRWRGFAMTGSQQWLPLEGKLSARNELTDEVSLSLRLPRRETPHPALSRHLSLKEKAKRTDSHGQCAHGPRNDGGLGLAQGFDNCRHGAAETPHPALQRHLSLKEKAWRGRIAADPVGSSQ